MAIATMTAAIPQSSAMVLPSTESRGQSSEGDTREKREERREYASIFTVSVISYHHTAKQTEGPDQSLA